MLPLPLDMDKQCFKSCCGKHICGGCIHAMVMEEIRRGKKEEELGIFAYCRTPRESSVEEYMERNEKMMEKGNAMAFYVLAGCYANGLRGMPQDRAKAAELWLKAGELGCSVAYYSLGNAYDNGTGVDRDKKKAKHYYELAAMMGNIYAWHNLGCNEYNAGNHERTYKHMIIAAKSAVNAGY